MRWLTWHLDDLARLTTRSLLQTLELIYAWSQSQSLRGIDRVAL
jgi:hypothetical protein